MFKLLVIMLLTFGFLLIYPGKTSAVSDTSDSGIVKVNHVAGFFEKINEKITLFFKFDKENKTDFYQKLLEKRLAELEFVIKNGQGDLIEETSSRYSAYLGTTADFIFTNKLTSKKDALLKMFDNHTKIIETLQSHFEFESGWWLLLQHNINSINIFRDKIKNL